MRNTYQTNNLVNYIGSRVNYKGYNLTVSEISANDARLTHPVTGETARISKIKLKELIECKQSQLA